jgi:hypothetical protein
MKPARPEYALEFFYTSFPQRDLVEWYKWEFLRRNPEYRADYKKFEQDHGAWLRRNGYWYDLSKRPHWTRSDEKHFYTRIAPTIVRLCIKWHVGDLHPPQRRFPKDSTGRFVAERPSGPATGFPPELNWDRPLMIKLFESGFTGTGGNARRYGHLMVVEFDLKWPMKDQLDFAKRVLIRAQENYKTGLQERGEHFPIGRRRFRDYDTHLKAWDLKQRDKSVAEIARTLFPTDHVDSVLQKVRDHLKAAQQLISGRYTEIR